VSAADAPSTPFNRPHRFARIKEGLMNSSTKATTTSSPFPLALRNAALVFLTLLLLLPSGNAVSAPNRSPDLGDCEELQAPAGSTVLFHVYAAGVQIYRWDGATWTFVAPEAELYADPGFHAVVGTHYAGPTWKSTSGGLVVASVLERCTVDSDAIPWLLLQAGSTEGPGVFEPVTYIQRVNTTGGLAPTTPGSFIGEEVRVPYTAEYFFYR
jgi:hypothetical protein